MRLSKINIRREGQPVVGEYVIWKREDIVLLNTEPKEDLDGVMNEDQEKEVGEGVRIMQRSSWISLLVEVIDESNVVFAVAMVTSINPDVVLEGIQLGDKYVGIMITKFTSGATLAHLKYKDCLVAWEILRLIAPDKKTLSYHHDNQKLELKDVATGKRSYVHRMRPRKKPRLIQSRKEKCLALDDILMISTKNCCRQRCCQHFDRKIAQGVREKYWKKSYKDRKEEAILAIQTCLGTDNREELIGLQGVIVCLEAWRIMHGKGQTQFNQLRKMVRAELEISEHGNIGKK